MRVAVRRSDSPERTILTFAIQDDDRVQLSCSGPPIPEEVLENALRAAGAKLPAEGRALEEVTANASQPDGATDTSKPVSDVELRAFVDQFQESLVEHGWDSEALPDADFSFTLEIDARTGRALGKNNPLHPYVSTEAAGLSGNIWTTLQSVINKGDDVAERMNEAVNRGDHVAAAQDLDSNEGKLAIAIGRHGRMLDAALRIDLSQLDAGLLNSVLRFIVSVGTARGRFRDAEPAAQELLQSDHTLSEEARFGIRNVLAIAAHKRGAREAAISTWQDLLRDRQKIDPGERGWIERNMATALLEKGTQAERLQAERALKRSADSFQQAGDKAEAARSLGQLVQVYQHTDAQAALAQYDEVLVLMDRENLLSATARASVLHSKAQRLLEIGQADQAAHIAREAVDLCRSVHGAEMELIASLHLVAIAAEHAGDVDAAQSARNEAREGQEQLKSRYFDFARRAMALLETFDAEEADALDAEARVSGTPEHIAMIEVIRVIRDERLSRTEKMERLEVHIVAMQAHGVDPELLQPARIAVAVLLAEEKEYERAARWWRKVLEVQPLDASANQALISVLWEAEVWGDAAIAIKEQLDRFGEAPNRLYAYGRSLFEAGDMDGAVRALTRSMSLAGEDQDLCIRARELRDRAFELGGSVTPPEAPAPIYGPVTLGEVRIALADFGAFVSSSKRMAFWTKPKGTKHHEWIARPEQFGQDLLHTFAKARFHERVTAFEEISVGAGRLDLLLQFVGGLAVVIELKMCGAGYSTTYASSGGEQVCHYLTNTTSHIGFVVVFDARKRHNAQPLGAAGTGTHTVEEVLIDVYPTVDP